VRLYRFVNGGLLYIRFERSAGCSFGRRRSGSIVIGGIIVGDFPPTFYLVTSPNDAFLPLTDMYLSGTFWGVVAGIVLRMVLGRSEPTLAA